MGPPKDKYRALESFARVYFHSICGEWLFAGRKEFGSTTTCTRTRTSKPRVHAQFLQIPKQSNCCLKGPSHTLKYYVGPGIFQQESNLKNMIFFALSFIVVAGFLGDKYYEYVQHKKRDRDKTKKEDKGSKQEMWADPDRQAVLTEAVRQVVQRKTPEPSA